MGNIISIAFKVSHHIRMKFFLAAAVAGVPALNRDDQCPSLDDLASAFTDHFGVDIPDGVIDCLHGGDQCPWDSVDEFVDDFQSVTGIQLPTPDEDDLAAIEECVREGSGCPSLEDAVNFVQTEFGVDISDEVIATIYNCAEDILAQLGIARK